MTYFASCGEALLIAALLLASHRAFHSHRDTKVKYILSLAMLFIATTATLGLLRFAGASSLISIHDTLSWFSTHFAMPIYAVLTALCFVADKRHLSRLLLALLLINSAFVFANVLLLTNVVIFIALVIAAFASPFRNAIIQAMAMLILVPLTLFLPTSFDLQMGIFHLVLALHFYLISEVYQNKPELSPR